MNASSTRVLIVEDSPTQSLLLQGTLEKHGFAVTAAAHGGLALESLAKSLPDLIISDVQMPEMDGYELCRRIKSDPALAEIPLLLLTSLSAPEDVIRGLECGADNFMVKPFEEAFLLERVHAMLANRELPAAAEDDGLPVFFAGERYVITAGRRQILTLLLSTYDVAVNTNANLIKAHEALKAAQAQLIEAEKLQTVGRLAAGVAHEVRNPLAILEMGLTFLDDAPVGEDEKTILGEMKEAVNRTGAIVSSLVELSAPRDLGMREMSVNDVIEQALRAVADRLGESEIALVKELGAGLPQSRIDSAKLEQAFVNVLTNAIDATPAGGTITVRTSARAVAAGEAAFDAGDRSGARFREGEQAVVARVCDTGPGIAPDDLGKIFEPFFSTKPTGKGMGLGLTVARKVVETHGGRLVVANHPEGGVLVTMMLKQA